MAVSTKKTEIANAKNEATDKSALEIREYPWGFYQDHHFSWNWKLQFHIQRIDDVSNFSGFILGSPCIPSEVINKAMISPNNRLYYQNAWELLSSWNAIASPLSRTFYLIGRKNDTTTQIAHRLKILAKSSEIV